MKVVMALLSLVIGFQNVAAKSDEIKIKIYDEETREEKYFKLTDKDVSFAFKLFSGPISCKYSKEGSHLAKGFREVTCVDLVEKKNFSPLRAVSITFGCSSERDQYSKMTIWEPKSGENFQTKYHVSAGCNVALP